MIENDAYTPPARRSAVRGILFDLDGTLANTLDDIAAALAHGLESVHRPAARPDDVRRWIGDGLPELCKRAAPDLAGTDLDRLIAATRSYYARNTVVHTRLYPGIEPVLERLRSRGLRLGVLSNKPHELTVETVRRLGLEPRFDVVRGYVTEEEKKPSPRVALEIARQWNLRPEKILVIGDSATDFQTAQAAGMPVRIVEWGFRTPEELATAGIAQTLKCPADIEAAASG